MQRTDTRLKENNLHHYFVPSTHSESEYFKFECNFNGKNFVFKSCPDVFSKNEVDYGSLVLIKSILKHKEVFGGDILDMCCGYGTIGIILSKFIDANFELSDVNSTATDLAKDNIKLNNCNISNVYICSMFEGIEKKYDHIVSNPPIKVGKKILLSFIDGAYSHLKDGGTLTLVIKKNLGASSLKDYILNKFGNCEIWQRDKGYYILHTMFKN